MKKENTKPAKPEHKGVMRNDLPGYMKLKTGCKIIYVRYKGQDFSTKQKNTITGWKQANAWWAKKAKELQAIEDGEKPAEDSIGNVFQKFLDYKIKISKVSKKTEIGYWTGFRAIFTNPDEPLTEFTVKNQIAKFVENSTNSAASVNTYLGRISCFLEWASDDDYNYVPAKKYTKKYRQKVAKSVKAPYTQEEYELLLSRFENKKEMYIFLQFLWNTGARVGESLAIKLTDLDLKNNRIIISNKIFKGQQEALLLTPEALKIVEQAREIAELRGGGKLFAWSDTNAPNKIIKRLERKLGMKADGRGLHGFRRAFCNRLFERGLDIVDIQEIMRHRDIETTLNYYKEFKQSLLVKKMSEKL